MNLQTVRDQTIPNRRNVSVAASHYSQEVQVPLSPALNMSFLEDFQQTLDKFAVPTGEQAELKAIVKSTRADIVFDSVTHKARHERR